MSSLESKREYRRLDQSVCVCVCVRTISSPPSPFFSLSLQQTLEILNSHLSPNPKLLYISTLAAHRSNWWAWVLVGDWRGFVLLGFHSVSGDWLGGGEGFRGSLFVAVFFVFWFFFFGFLDFELGSIVLRWSLVWGTNFGWGGGSGVAPLGRSI